LESEARASRQGRLADYLTRLDSVVLDELGYLPSLRPADSCSSIWSAGCTSALPPLANGPETIESDFVDRSKLDRRRNTLLDSCLQQRKKVGQFAPVTAESFCLHIFLLPDAIDAATHVETTQL
jgi:hypothetical protein